MSWQIVAKKEYLENVRNAWILAVGGIFLFLTLVSSGFAGILASGGNARFADISTTINSMSDTAGFFLPILALMLGFGTISGERESGSLGLLVAQPISRLDILVGKGLGLFGVLASALLAGAGLGGLIVIAATGADPRDITILMLFLLCTLAWSAAWLSITLFLSSFFQRRGTTIGGALFAWFFFSRPVWFLIGLGIISAVLGSQIDDMAGGGPPDVPGGLILLMLLNPNLAYDGLLSTLVPEASGIVATLGRELLGDAFQAPLFALALAAWIALPFFGAYARFRSRDI